MKCTLAKATKSIYSHIKPLSLNESVPLMKAFGRVSAKDIRARFDIPPFPISLRDGRVVKKGDDLDSPSSLLKIFTGQKVPKDTLFIIEEESVHLKNDKKDLTKEIFIKSQGEDIRKDELLVRRGSKIGPFDITNLATQGMHTIAVLKEARIAYVGVGNELIDVSAPAQKSSVFNSNAYTLASRGEMMGARTATITNTSDSKEAILQIFEDLEHVDAIITSGGMSKNDSISSLLNSSILKPLFQGVAIAPAGLSALSFYNSTPILHLPGLPMSALLGFEVIGAALIRRLYGMSGDENKIVTKSTKKIKAHPFSQSIVPGIFNGESFSPKKIAAGMINVLNYCNGFIFVDSKNDIDEGGEIIFYPFLSWN